MSHDDQHASLIIQLRRRRERVARYEEERWKELEDDFQSANHDGQTPRHSVISINKRTSRKPFASDII